MIHKTWEEFWGPLLLLRFHLDNPERWKARKRRAQWLFDQLSLQAGAKILNLGCGDGVLDICLAELGAEVTGVDRLRSVLKHASSEGAQHSVQFVESDLREVAFAPSTFDVVCLFEVIGLMNAVDDAILLERAAGWLRPGGHLLIDCQKEPQEALSHWERHFSDGVLSVALSYDPTTRTQTFEPTFQTSDGSLVDLVDPYDETRGKHSGIRRHLYTKPTLVSMLIKAGLESTEIPHYERPHLFLLRGTKPFRT